MSSIFYAIRWVAAVGGVAGAVWASPVGAQGDVASLARRIATISSIAVDEYALGVRAGRIESQDEYDEAVLFLDEALALAGGLPIEARDAALGMLGRLASGVRGLETAAELAAGVGALRTALAERLDLVLDPPPRVAPSLRSGAALYRANCATCHGTGGAGDGPGAAELSPPPSDFTDRSALAAASPLDFFRKISVGIAGTGMASFEDGLSTDERWALALYTTTLRYDDGERAAGARWLDTRCPECGVVASGFAETAMLTDDSLAAVLQAAAGAPAPPEAVAFARSAGAAEGLGGDRRMAVLRVVHRVDAGVRRAIDLGAAGDAEAARSAALAAYLEFEQIETQVAARNATAAQRVEAAFSDLRGALARGSAAEVEQARATLSRRLDGAADVLTDASSPAALFGQSIVIVLREGLEALLIVGALMAVLTRAGAGDRRREILVGVAAALLASGLTAVGFATVLQVTAAGREAIEGITMLLASVVLFWVASWLVSKIEAEKWKAFVGTRMRAALSSRKAWALAGVAFLAVYREGVETVLFYAALYSSAEGPAGASGVTAGLVAGSAVLLVMYGVLQRSGVRIPIRPFFAVTGILLTVMAVSFAGQGVAELQAAGWMPATPLARLPSLPALGVFPTVQTLAAQFLCGAAFLAAVAWIFWISPRPAVSAVPRRRP